MSERKPLVSIITPCYNGEHCLSRLLDSIIAQTYRPIEFILVNDGSTDNTQNIAEDYVPSFMQAEIQYQIIRQENKGLGGAIDTGLKAFKGDYLCWPDADDYLEPTSVEKRVQVLEENREYAVVSSDAYIRQCDHLDTFEQLVSSTFKYKNDPFQFEHHLKGESIFCSGCHMVRVSMFLDVNPQRSIYPARHGQNWQMLLPIYHKYKWVFLDEPLYNYIIYPQSMSHTRRDYTKLINEYHEQEEIICQTLEMIERNQGVDLTEKKKVTQGKYNGERLKAAAYYHEVQAFKKELAIKKKNASIDKRDLILYLRCHLPVIDNMMQKIRTQLRHTRGARPNDN